MPPLPFHAAFAYSTISIFILYFFSFGVEDTLSNGSRVDVDLSPHKGIPDFTRYEHLKTLDKHEFPSNDQSKRIIIVGDVHGMYDPFKTLLTTLSYNPPTDVLIHLGDIVTKGSHAGSLAVLSYMTTYNVTGVRGNHDQQVIEWRGWLNWIRTLPGGSRWLDDEERRHKAVQASGGDDTDIDAWSDERRAQGIKNESTRQWWKKVPDGWKLFGDHCMIAKDMTQEQYDYLLALPLKIHAPSAHTFLIHAGLLPSDPRYPPNNHRQPLAHVPKLSAKMSAQLSTHPNDTIPMLRNLQEKSLLSAVPQNKNPWVNLNMRSIFKSRVSRRKKGEPWPSLWNDEMSHCQGYHSTLFKEGQIKEGLPCYPSTVVYGHTASRDLDINRWSFGLDTGCVYKRRLTALVLGQDDLPSTRWKVRNAGKGVDEREVDDDDNDDDEEEDMEEDDDNGDDEVEADKKKKKNKHKNKNKHKDQHPIHVVPFGDSSQAMILSVSCA